jgi:hypothetical protein
MAIGDNFSVAANGDIRHDLGATYYETIELHRWLQAIATGASAIPDDLVDINADNPSKRKTDNIVELLGNYNIDDATAAHIFNGSITQASGAERYSGLVVKGTVVAGAELMVVQDNALLSAYWGTGLNTDPANIILLRIMIKTRTGGVDIDGGRILVMAREFGDKFAEFPVTLGVGNETAAIFTSADLNNKTAEGTVAGWTSITNTEGYRALDVNNDATDEHYYSEWDADKPTRSGKDFYERTKWLQRRGMATAIYGIPGQLFRGITHEVDVIPSSGTFNAVEECFWGTGATAGTGQLLAIDDPTTPSKVWIQLLKGVAPTDGETIEGVDSGAVCDIDTTIVAKTVSPEFVGVYTGSSIIGAFGIGIELDDLSAADLLFDLEGADNTPPNAQLFSVAEMADGLDYVLVANNNGGAIDFAQLTLNGAISSGASTIVVNETIPLDTPAAGTIRVFDSTSGVRERVTYTSYSGSTFSGCGNAPDALDDAECYISYLDKAVSGVDPVTESVSMLFQSQRTFFVRVRGGTGGAPIEEFVTTGIYGSGGGSVTAIRNSDA